MEKGLRLRKKVKGALVYPIVVSFVAVAILAGIMTFVVPAFEEMFTEIEASLDAIEFFKSRSNVSIMRSIREIGHRVTLDVREVKLVKAIAIEVRKFIARMGR